MRSLESHHGRSFSFTPRTTTTRRRRSKDRGSFSRRPASRRTSGSRRAAVTLAPSTLRRSNTARGCSISSLPRCASSVGWAVRSERGDDLLDVPEMLELVLEDPAHHLARRPSPPHYHVIELRLRGLHDRESLKCHAMDGLERVVRIRRPLLESRQKGPFG